MNITHTIQKKVIVAPTIIAFSGCCQLFFSTCQSWSISVEAIKAFFSAEHADLMCSELKESFDKFESSNKAPPPIHPPPFFGIILKSALISYL